MSFLISFRVVLPSLPGGRQPWPRAFIQRKGPYGWSKCDSIGWKEAPFFSKKICAPKNVCYTPFGGEFPALMPLSDVQKHLQLALGTLISKGSTAFQEGIQLSDNQVFFASAYTSPVWTLAAFEGPAAYLCISLDFSTFSLFGVPILLLRLKMPVKRLKLL